jgi:hypothetical protein
VEVKKGKFNRFLPAEQPMTVSSCTVIILTEFEVTDDQTIILPKGGDFAVTPKLIPAEDIVANTEAVITSLPLSKAQEVHTEDLRILRRSKPSRRHIKKL